MSILEKSSSMELSRRTQPFYAKKQSYNLGEQVQIEVDLQREMLDFENSRCFADLVFTTGASSTTRMIPWCASALIKNLRVKTLAGQMIGHEIREYRAWCRMYKELASNSDKNESYDDILESANSQDLGDAGAHTFRLGHKFMSHLFTVKEYYPAHFHQGLMIEFDLPSTANELFTYETNIPTSVSVQNIKYVADLVQLKPEIEDKMVKMMEQQQLFVDYTEVLTQENTIAASTGQQAYDVVGIDGRVKAIFSYQIQASLRTGIGAAEVGDFLGNKRHNNLGSYRYKLGANYLNYQNIEVGNTTALSFVSAEQCYELAKALDFHDSKAWGSKAGDSALVRGALQGSLGNSLDNMVQAVKVDKAQKNSNDVISSMVDKDRNNVRVELNYHTAPAGILTGFTHTLLDKRIQILPGSIVRNVRS